MHCAQFTVLKQLNILVVIEILGNSVIKTIIFKRYKDKEVVKKVCNEMAVHALRYGKIITT
jgi:hypothetical protein